MTIIPTVAWQLDALLGEGPAWFDEEAALRFVDIKGGKVHRFDPATGLGETWQVGGMPSAILPEEGGGVLVASQHGIYRLSDGQLGSPVHTLDQPAHNRTNDATVDSQGRMWLATMDNDESEATGAVWCLDHGKLKPAGGKAVITNGPAVNGDASVLYRVDSGERTIWRHSIGDHALLGEGDIFLQLGEADGHPDGIVVDSEDCLWVALWDGWGVRRYAPDGTLLLKVDLPCARVTKIAFGGTDLRTVYVTTARVGLDAAALAAQPLAGSLFTFRSPVAGRKLPAVLRG